MNSFRGLVKAIRKEARTRLRVSRTHWKEYKKLRQWSGMRFVRRGGLYALFLGLMTVSFAVSLKNQKFPLILLTLYSAATILGRANGLSELLYKSGDLAFSMHSPVTDKQFFDYAWLHFLKSSLFVWFYSFLAFAYLALAADGRGTLWAASIIAATLQWLLVVSLAVLVALVLQRWPSLMKLAAPLYLSVFAMFFVPASVATPIWKVLQSLPTAWISMIFEKGVIDGQARALSMLPLVLLILSSLPLTYGRLRKTYPMTELLYPLAGNTPGSYGDDEYQEVPGERDWQSETWENTSPTANPRIMVAHLRPLDWSCSGWLERVAARLMNSREKAIGEFLCGGGVGFWSAQWRRACMIAAIGMIAVFLGPWIPVWIPVCAGIIASMFALPVLGGFWSGMQPIKVYGMERPAFADFPLSYTEISRVLAKVNLLRCAAWLPIGLFYAAMLAWRVKLPVEEGIQIGVGIILIVISLQPLLIVGRFSLHSDDTKKLTLHSVGMTLIALCIALLFLFLMLILFAWTQWAPPEGRAVTAVVAMAGLFCCSLTLWFCYRIYFDRGRVDTMRSADN